MKHFFTRISALLVIAAVCATQGVFARQLTPEEAIDAAVGKPALTVGTKVSPKATPRHRDYRLLRTEKNQDLSTVYIMQSPAEGKVLFLSADDVARPVLGWCDSGSFALDSIPPALQYMLDCYSLEIAEASKSGAAPYSATTLATESRADIAPLVTTHWNQSAPFNNMCPEYEGNRSVTGCVATAMAQVMNYHEWPKKATGTYTYHWTLGDQDLSIDLSTVSFDWDNMLDDYTSSATDAQQNAVAELMKVCGYLSDMAYSPSESGAASSKAVSALAIRLGYAKDIHMANRSSYALTDWIALLYSELADGRPIMYSGRNSSSGHAFVIDGYQSGDLFHVNWGWGGMSDGYFAICALDPANQGIGGSPSGYNLRQTAAIGVRPNDGTTAFPAATLTVSGNLITDAETYERYSNEAIPFRSTDTFICLNNSTTAASYTYGVKLTNVSTGEVTFLPYGQGTLPPGYGMYSIEVQTVYFPVSGEYYVEFAALDASDEYAPLETDFDIDPRLHLRATNTHLLFTEVEQVLPEMTAETRHQDTVLPGNTLTIESDVTATDAEYYGAITPIIVDSDGNQQNVAPVIADILPGQTKTLVWKVVLPSDFASGSYNLFIVDKHTRTLSATTFTVTKGATGDPQIEFYEPYTNAVSGSGSYSDPWIFDTHIIQMSATVTNSGGLYSNDVFAYVFDFDTGQGIGALAMQKLTIDIYDEVPFIVNCNVEGALEYDKTYIMAYCIYNTAGTSIVPQQPYYYFQISSTAGIESVTAPDSENRVTLLTGNLLEIAAEGQLRQLGVYSVTGTEVFRKSYYGTESSDTVNLGSLEKGVYIVRLAQSGSESVIVRKIVIR